MRIDDYFLLDSALRRNQDLVRLCDAVQYRAGVNRKRIDGIKKRAKGLVQELTALKAEWDEALQGNADTSPQR